MAEQSKLSKFIKIFGFLYFLANCMAFAVICVMTIYTMVKTPQFTPGWILLIVPTAGILSGRWIRIGKYGWARSFVIALSLLATAAILFIALVAGPQAEKIHKGHAEIAAKVAQLDEDVERMFLGIYEGDVNILREQLDKGVYVNAWNVAGATPLHAARDKDIIELLISRGADVNAPDESGKTPMFYKEVEGAKVLVEAGADINARSNNGSTLLLWNSYSGYIEGVKYVHSLGVDVNVKNLDGQTAYDIAESFGHSELLEYLKSIGAKPGKEIN